MIVLVLTMSYTRLFFSAMEQTYQYQGFYIYRLAIPECARAGGKKVRRMVFFGISVIHGGRAFR